MKEANLKRSNKISKEEFLAAIAEFAKKQTGEIKEQILSDMDWFAFVADYTAERGGYLYIREDGLPSWSRLKITDLDAKGKPFGDNWHQHMLFELKKAAEEICLKKK